MEILSIISSTIITLIPIGMIIPNSDIVCGGDFAGIYDGERIYICDLKDGSQEFYINHERGHVIWSKLSDKQKKQYERIYKLHHKLGLNAFYREYGYSDIEEDFADNIALLQIKEPVNKYVYKRIKIILKFLTF